jgi:hypothetical protein
VFDRQSADQTNITLTYVSIFVEHLIEGCIEREMSRSVFRKHGGRTARVDWRGYERPLRVRGFETEAAIWTAPL